MRGGVFTGIFKWQITAPIVLLELSIPRQSWHILIRVFLVKVWCVTSLSVPISIGDLGILPTLLLRFKEANVLTPHGENNALPKRYVFPAAVERAGEGIPAVEGDLVVDSILVVECFAVDN